METKQVIEQVSATKTAGGQLLEQAQRAEVIDQGTASRMTDLLGVVKARLKASEDARTALVKPLNDHVKWINTQFKGSTGDLTEADHIGRGKLSRYLAEQDRAEAAKAAALRKEAEDRAIADAEAAEAAGRSAEAEQLMDTAAAIPDAPKAAPTRGSFGASAGTTKRWTFEVDDIRQVPAQFLQVDAAAIREAIRNGERTIPGVRIYQESKVSIR